MAITKEIKFMGRNDFAAYVNGQCIGNWPTSIDAQIAADKHAYELLANNHVGPADEVASDVNAVTLASEPAAAEDVNAVTLASDVNAVTVSNENNVNAVTLPQSMITIERNLKNIDRATVAAIVASARERLNDDRRWLNALNKAYQELELNQWLYTGRVLKIKSRSSAKTTYTVTPNQCTCQAFAKGQPCWHRAAAKLLQRASVTSQPAA